MSKYQVTPDGNYGRYGGAWVPEMLYPNVERLRREYLKILDSDEFKSQYFGLLRDYVGRPTPLTFAKRISEIFGANIYLKREDLAHTGAHKINNALGQVIMAKMMGKDRIIA